MNRLVSSLLAACVLLAPGIGFAQNEAPAAAGQIEGAAPGAAPDSGKGAEASVGHAGGEGEAHATPHYPLEKPELMSWSFAGPFGHWDLGQLQRGLKVYKEVCSACHSMNLVDLFHEKIDQ